ncbi:MAG: acyl carrier protein, partial [Bacteroidales bacterium]|nr:acyl carrier protein [Bacteroidales bacterium]
GGVLESLDIVSFLFAVSDDLGVTIPVAKIKPAHFDSLDKMLDLINNLK